MTNSERREYMRAWRKSHREQIKDTVKRRRVDKYLASLNLDKQSLQAYLMWIKDRTERSEYIPILGKVQSNGRPVVVFYCEAAPDGYCYSVQYAGNGHYFKSKAEAIAYIKSRGFTM